jgi:hypothetical protein
VHAPTFSLQTAGIGFCGVSSWGATLLSYGGAPIGSSLTVVIEANRGSGQQLTMEDDHRAPVARRRTGGRRRR